MAVMGSRAACVLCLCSVCIGCGAQVDEVLAITNNRDDLAGAAGAQAILDASMKKCSGAWRGLPRLCMALFGLECEGLGRFGLWLGRCFVA